MILATLHGESDVTPSGYFVPDRVSRIDRHNQAFWLSGCCLLGPGDSREIELPFRINQVELEDGSVFNGAYYPTNVTLNGDATFNLSGGVFESVDPYTGQLNGFSLGKLFKFKMPKLNFPKINIGAQFGKFTSSIGKSFGKFTSSIGKQAGKIAKQATRQFSNVGKAFEKGVKGIGKGIEQIGSQVLQPAMDLLSSGATPGSYGAEEMAQTAMDNSGAVAEEQAAADPYAWQEDQSGSGMYYNQAGEWYDPASGQIYDPTTGQWSQANAA